MSQAVLTKPLEDDASDSSDSSVTPTTQALCDADCTEHDSHQAMVLGPDGKLYPAPTFYTRPPGRIKGFFLRLSASQPWIAPIALLMCMALPVAYVLNNNPTDETPDLGGCAFKLVTGFDCPGCGGTRAFWYFLHGNLPEAARYHAIAVFAAPFLIYAYVAWASRRMFPKMKFKLPRLQLGPNTVAVFLSVWGAYWVIRNLPWAPFTSLFV